MKAIRDNAELSVRQLFKDTAKKMGKVIRAVDYMDNGAGMSSSLCLDWQYSSYDNLACSNRSYHHVQYVI